MIRYRMLGLDINSNPFQYRTWVIANEPDFTGEQYIGLKSGNNDLVNITAYQITDDNVIADFSLPLPADWQLTNIIPNSQPINVPIRKILPAAVEDSQLAIIDGYAYLFGGKVSNKIYKANLNNPADWVDTGARLPTTLYGSQLAIVNSVIYLFGGNSGDGYGPDGYGEGATSNVFSAPISNPLSWTSHSNVLPQKLDYSSLGMSDGYLYLFGGRTSSGLTSSIFRASTSNPLVWTDTGNHLPISVCGSNIAQIDGYWFLFGGLTGSNPSPGSGILRASNANPLAWISDGYLPYATAFSQFITVGDDGYLIGPMVGSAFTGFTPIIQCHLINPTIWFDTNRIVPGVISHSQSAIIYDRLWLFGGSGETAMFACNQQNAYSVYDSTVIAYGQITRALLQNFNNLNNPFEVLCFPYWKTDYLL